MSCYGAYPTVSALQILYQLGLIHRDVSAGNILLVDGVGKLTDLEFMRSYRGPINPSSLVDRYIGTANFTAGEVAAARYAYPSTAHGAKHFSEDPPFRFNPFHDVESTLGQGFLTSPLSLSFHQDDRSMPDDRNPVRFLLVGVSHPFNAVLEVLHDVRFDLYRRYMLFESDFTNQYRFLEDEMVPLSSSPFRDVHSIVIAHYEKAALCSEGLVFLERARTDTSKRKATTAPATPEPPAKKLKRTSL
ncbi:hypothetical protein R3P38DRAFT_3198221 [Favolaschia claudopus]|uniref:Protein kinase domain-containing protein n=1 Tax=Favolaschia claudopus TaxID=2862362 RepID=A0AAW0B290_9AGAR